VCARIAATGGQSGVVERLDPEGDDPDVGAPDEPRGLLVVARAEPHDLRAGAAPRGIRVAGDLVRMKRADGEDRQLGHALAHRPQQRPVAPPPEVAERDGDDAAPRIVRREAVGRERDELRLPAGLALQPGELVAGDEGQRRAGRRLLVQLGEPRAEPRPGVVRHLVPVPAPVPELGLRPRGDDRARERPLHRVEDDDGAQVPVEPPQQALRGRTRQPRGDGRGHPGERPVAHGRRVGGDDALGAQEVLCLVAQDERLERAGEQQQADRSAHRVRGR
jgi:hypothetical protein